MHMLIRLTTALCLAGSMITPALAGDDAADASYADPALALAVLPAGEPRLLTQPFLQAPTRTSVRVVWLTNFAGARHELEYGDGRKMRRAPAKSVRIDRLLEDPSSRSPALPGALTEVVRREVWRHEAIATGLTTDRRLPYRVRSQAADGREIVSGEYTLRPLPRPGRALRILLTSDQQNRYGFPAATQTIESLFGPLDAVFFAGDYVDNPRQASEWFDRFDPAWTTAPAGAATAPRPYPNTRPAFFPSMQGNYQEVFPEFPWRGGAILQHAPKFGAIGNHEQPGRFRPNARVAVNGQTVFAGISYMDNDPQPRWYAALRYEEQKAVVNPDDEPRVRAQWIRDHSHDFEVHRKIWTHPRGPLGEQFYAQQFGDVFLVTMNVARVWRTFNVRPQDRGKFTEFVLENRNPDEWGFGDFHFDRFDRDSKQYRWLKRVLESPQFQRSKFRVVMAHHSVAGLGDNGMPVHADNVMYLDLDDGAGGTTTLEVRFPTDRQGRIATFETQVRPVLDRVQRVRYEYPLSEDIWKNDIEPLLVDARVQLVHIGHSHVWSRTHVTGSPDVHYLETSSAGNTFGAYWTQPDGTPWNGALRGGNTGLFAAGSPWNTANYPRTGDPHDRPAIFPSLANPMELWAGAGQPLPFVASNDISTFSILDTEMAAVRSFAVNLRDRNQAPLEFDRIALRVD